MVKAVIREVGETWQFPDRPGLSIVRLLPEGDIPSIEIVSAKLEDGSVVGRFEFASLCPLA